MNTLKQTFAQWIVAFQSRVSPEKFTRRMLWLAGVWFLGIYPAMQWFCPFLLSREMNGGVNPPGWREHFPPDFPQYYMGALAVDNHLWGELYPTAKPEYYNAPPDFQPRWKTFLFDEQKMREERSQYYYLAVVKTLTSNVSPGLLKLCPTLNDYTRYVYPPPFALLIWPLAWFKLETAMHVWATLLMASLFGLSYYSSRIHRLLRGRATYTEGLIVLAIVFFSIRGRTSIGIGNVSSFLSFMIAWASYSWMNNRQGVIGFAMIPLLLAKSITLNWCPLLLLGRIRWKTLGVLALLTLLLNGATLALGGTQVYHTYFHDILPKLAVPNGDGIVRMVMDSWGIYPKKLWLLLTATACLLIYVGYYRGTKAAASIQQKAAIAAALAGCMAVFVLLNFSSHADYHPMYLFFPFLGWIAWEAQLAVGKWKTVLTGTIIAGLILWLLERFFLGGLFHTLGGEAVGWFFDLVYRPIAMQLLPILVYYTAIRRLYFAPATSDIELSRP